MLFVDFNIEGGYNAINSNCKTKTNTQIKCDNGLYFGFPLNCLKKINNNLSKLVIFNTTVV